MFELGHLGRFWSMSRLVGFEISSISADFAEIENVGHCMGGVHVISICGELVLDFKKCGDSDATLRSTKFRTTRSRQPVKQG